MASRDGRRTQAERTSATRAAILDAAIECLIDDGYAGTTTRRIAARARVTPGALHHHFTSKSALFAEAIRRARTRFAEEMISAGPPDAPSADARTEQLLDRMWAMHLSPLFHAMTELLVAARTDPELRVTLIDVQREAAELNAAAIPVLFPEVSDQQRFAELVDTGQAAIRGLAMLAFVDPETAQEMWPITRAHIIALAHLPEDDPR
ncbi:MAG TPA: helix-turn-helix domain-containing protein [Solirubrobacteraceae bacterium]|jgi:AcrR family transcriptional regulator|nr:helix-turn-helix domain-containing protein [Solirubrobacteraceae bacterium]